MKNYINHISLTVSNAKDSADFYENALGWTVKAKEDDYAILVPQNGGFMFGFGEAEEKIADNGFNKNRIGLHHFAFSVYTMEELEGIESRLKAAGVEMEEGGIMPDDGHGMSIFCKDPDGMKVEVRLVKSE
jgi:catechol 2,3-dioxygenase-like lactoylglutathione lyase family enzyme